MRLPGELLVAAIVASGDAAVAARYQGAGDLMTKEAEKSAWAALRRHLEAYGTVPGPEAAAEAGIELPSRLEPPGYYHDKLRNRHALVKMQAAARDVQARLRSGEPAVEVLASAREAFDGLAEAVADRQDGQLLQLRDAWDVLLPRYRARAHQGGGGALLGWATLDSATNGLGAGDVLSFVGKPGTGKSMCLVWMALAAFRAEGERRSVLFVSPEMSAEEVLERAATVLAGIPVMELRRQRGRRMPKARFDRFRAQMTSEEFRNDGVGFAVMDGPAARDTRRVLATARRLRPGLVVVDGGKLMEHGDSWIDRDTFKRATATSKFVKNDLAVGLGVPVVCAWQFNREGRKLKAGERPALHHIADTDSVGQDSSLVLGMLEEESVETLEARTVYLMKGRHGEAGEWKVRWDWERMDFGEYDPGDADDFRLTSGDAGDT